MENKDLLEILAVLLIGVFTILIVQLYRDEDSIHSDFTVTNSSYEQAGIFRNGTLP